MIMVGLPIVPRSKMEPFHMTLGVVNTTFPVEEVMFQINHEITTWSSPITFRRYFVLLPPRIVTSFGDGKSKIGVR